jgi:hypothetical protein
LKLSFIIFSVFVLILTACMAQQPSLPSHASSNQVSTQRPVMKSEGFSIVAVPMYSPVTEEGWALKASGSYFSAVYNIKGTFNAQSIRIWLDHYMKGKPSKTQSRIDFGTIKTQESLIPFKMYFNTFDIEKDKQMWVLSIRSQSNSGGGMNTIRQNVTPRFNSTSAFTPMGAEKIRLGKPVELGVIVYSSNPNNGAYIGEISETIKQSDEVYILKCQFD